MSQLIHQPPVKVAAPTGRSRSAGGKRAVAAAAAAVAVVSAPPLDSVASDPAVPEVAGGEAGAALAVAAAGTKKRGSESVAAADSVSAAQSKKKRTAVRHIELVVPVDGRADATTLLRISKKPMFVQKKCFGAQAQSCVICLEALDTDPTKSAGCDGSAFLRVSLFYCFFVIKSQTF
jgi:hypothetical protein